MENNIDQDDADAYAAIAQIAEMEAVKPPSRADAFIESMQNDDGWPSEPQFSFDPNEGWPKPRSKPWQPAERTVDDILEEILESITNVENGIDAAVDVGKSATMNSSLAMRGVERLLKENMILCQHICEMESSQKKQQAQLDRIEALLLGQSRTAEQ